MKELAPPAPASSLGIRPMTAYAFLAIAASCLGGLTFGLDINSISWQIVDGYRDTMDMPHLKAEGDPTWVADLTGWINACFHLSAMVSAPISGVISDRYGRRATIVGGCILFIIGALLQVCAGLGGTDARAMMLIGRLIAGFGNGFECSVVPVYASELAPAHWRGWVVTLFQLMITVGIWFCCTLNTFWLALTYSGWRLNYGLQAISALFLLILTFFLPESPRYYIKQGDNERGIATLRKLADVELHPEFEAIVQAEFKEIEAEVWEAEAAGHVSWTNLFQGTSLTALIVGASVSGIQQITGVNWFMNYSTNIITTLGLSPLMGSFGLNTINMVATFATFFLVDRIGRKQLLVWGTNIVLAVFLVMTIIYFIVPDVAAVSELAWTVLIVIYVFQAAYAITWGPMGWLIPAEVMPVHVRGKGAGIATAANMFLNFAFGDKIPIITQQPQVWGMKGTCLMFLLVNIFITLPYVYLVLPETAKVSMEEMRGVLNYRYGGAIEGDNAGTWGEFIHRNWTQTLDCLRCRMPDTRLGLITPLLLGSDGTSSNRPLGEPEIRKVDA